MQTRIRPPSAAPTSFAARRLRSTAIGMGVAGLLLVASTAISVLPMRAITRLLGLHRIATPVAFTSAPANSEQPVSGAILRVTQRVHRDAQRLPWRPACLSQALAAMVLLRVRGIEATLHLGLARNESAELKAHAWVSHGNEVILGASEGPTFTEVARYSRRPARIPDSGVSP